MIGETLVRSLQPWREEFAHGYDTLTTHRLARHVSQRFKRVSRTLFILTLLVFFFGLAVGIVIGGPFGLLVNAFFMRGYSWEIQLLCMILGAVAGWVLCACATVVMLGSDAFKYWSRWRRFQHRLKQRRAIDRLYPRRQASPQVVVLATADPRRPSGPHHANRKKRRRRRKRKLRRPHRA